MDEKKYFPLRFGMKKQKKPENEIIGEGSYDLTNEHAAAYEEELEEEMPVLNKLQGKGEKQQKSSSSLSPLLKKIGLAALAAALIGVVLGFLLMRYTAGIGTETNGETIQPAGASQASIQAETGAFASLSTYAVQAGVYTQAESGQALLTELEEAGYPAVLWEKEGQYFLLAGIAASEADADAIGADLTAAGFESYVKEWSAGAVSEDQQWLDQLATLISAGENQQASIWTEWLASVPAEATAVQAAAQTAIQSMEEGTFTESILLPVWHEAAAFPGEE